MDCFLWVGDGVVSKFDVGVGVKLLLWGIEGLFIVIIIQVIPTIRTMVPVRISGFIYKNKYKEQILFRKVKMK